MLPSITIRAIETALHGAGAGLIEVGGVRRRMDGTAEPITFWGLDLSVPQTDGPPRRVVLALGLADRMPRQRALSRRTAVILYLISRGRAVRATNVHLAHRPTSAIARSAAA